MKEILIMRHAKSSWADRSLEDIERPLNDRGIRDASKMGRWIREISKLPKIIYCSTSKRTIQTADIFMKAAGGDIPIRYEEKLYNGFLEDILNILHYAQNNVNRIMILGHSPYMEESISFLCSNNNLVLKMVTASIALLKTEVSWQKLSGNLAVLKFLIGPKYLNGF